jgi:thiamine biosynthesis lipoprotein
LGAVATLALNFGAQETPWPQLTRSGSDFLFSFHAMATPCEVRLETDDDALAEAAAHAAVREALRIEQKFSRYRSDSIIGKINSSNGAEVVVDTETSQLMTFAAHCFDVSGGLFDVTSGVLRRIWKFDGSDRIPDDEQVAALKPLIGWQKVLWKSPSLFLPKGMEIDLGGLGKEYAVDRALAAISAVTSSPALVNFGGDLRVSGPRRDGVRWNVAIESVEQSGGMAGMVELANGALATSGDSRRFLLKDGVRYGHILNPRTGRPVERTPRSITVAAATCVEAGMIATLAMLQGKRAEKFLKREGARAWCIR